MADTALHIIQMQRCLERMRAGDPAAREELFRITCDRLERLARRMLRQFPQVRRWAETGDVLQNALLRLLRTLENLKPDSTRAFFGLAAQEIRRELIDLARQLYGPEGLGANHDSNGPHDGAQLPVEPIDTSHDTADLDRWYRFHQAVENLPTEHREVVSLIFYHGWTRAQVADLFQVNERTIRRRWQEALLRLHAALAGPLPSTVK
jgi:RNA polymerase sigma-70 factor (ECF subfamily)